MSQSVTIYVGVNVTLEGEATPTAGFGTPMRVFETAIGSPARLLGPYFSAEEVIDTGFAITDDVYLFAQAIFGQPEAVDKFYIGRADAADADMAATLAAIDAASAGEFYLTTIASRADQDILDLAAWQEGRGFGISIAQTSSQALLDGTGPIHTATVAGTATDGDYELEFDEDSLGAPVPITVTRAVGVPATNADLATALAAAIVAEIGVGGDLEGIITGAEAVGTTVVYTLARGLTGFSVTESAPAPGTLVDAVTDADVAGQMFAAQYTRTALLYHATDAHPLDGAWASNCLAFDLDVQKGIWAYKRVSGIASDNLSNAQVAAIRSVNANYFSPATMTSGLVTQAFTAQGWMPFGAAGAGRRIDVMTTVDWSRARFEEAFMSMLLAAPRGIRYDDTGIARADTTARGVLGNGVKAEHFLANFKVPVGEPFAGVVTPTTVNVPRVAGLTSTIRQSRTLTFGAVAYIAQSIEKVVFNFNVGQ